MDRVDEGWLRASLSSIRGNEVQGIAEDHAIIRLP
jgi:hypothetical protein